MSDKHIRKKDSREAYLRRLEMYWRNKSGLKFNTYVGEIYEVDFGENVGSEFSGRHLAICLSDTKITEDRILVIPLSTKYEQYNLTDIVECCSFVDNKPIKGGVVLNEVRFISKMRVFKTSNILEESKNDTKIAVGKINLTKDQVKKFRTINI